MGEGYSRRGGGSKYNEQCRMLKFSRLSFTNKLELGPIQGDLIVWHYSNVAWFGNKKKETIEYRNPGEVHVHM